MYILYACDNNWRAKAEQIRRQEQQKKEEKQKLQYKANYICTQLTKA